MLEIATQNIAKMLGNELTNALMVGVIYGLVLSDLRKYLSIEKFFEFFKIKSILFKIICFIGYYILLITLGLIGLVLVLFAFELL